MSDPWRTLWGGFVSLGRACGQLASDVWGVLTFRDLRQRRAAQIAEAERRFEEHSRGNPLHHTAVRPLPPGSPARAEVDRVTGRRK